MLNPGVDPAQLGLSKTEQVSEGSAGLSMELMQKGNGSLNKARGPSHLKDAMSSQAAYDSFVLFCAANVSTFP